MKGPESKSHPCLAVGNVAEMVRVKADHLLLLLSVKCSFILAVLEQSSNPTTLLHEQLVH